MLASKEFQKVSKNNWLAAINKSLKDQKAEDLIWEVDPYVKISPFQHPEDTPQVPILHFPSKPSGRSIATAIPILEYNRATNDRILFLLRQGVNALTLRITQEANLQDWVLLMRDVNLNYISIYLAAEDWNVFMPSVLEWDQYLALQGYNRSQMMGGFKYSGDPSMIYSQALELDKLFPAYSLFYLSTVLEDHNPSQCLTLAQLIRDTHQVSQSLEMPFDWTISKTHWGISSSPLYFVEVVKLKALLWAWYLYLESQNITGTPIPHIESLIGIHVKNAEQSLIEATVQTVGSFQAGSQNICIEAFGESEGDQDYQRLAINIQHLLTLESGMVQPQDPMSGSYYFSALLSELAQAIWKAV